MSKFTKSLASTTALALVAALSAATLATYTLTDHTEAKKETYIDKSLKETQELFNELKDDLNLTDEQLKEFSDLEQAALKEFNDANSDSVKKIEALKKLNDKLQELAGEWVTNTLQKDNLTKEDVKKLETFLKHQQARLRESDLISQFKSENITNLKTFFQNIWTTSKEDNVDFYNQYIDKLNSKLDEQETLIAKYLKTKDSNDESYSDYVTEIKTLLPSKALRFDLQNNIDEIETALTAKNFRINDIEINERLLIEKLSNIREDKTQLQKLADIYKTKYNDLQTQILNHGIAFINDAYNKIFPLSTDDQFVAKMNELSSRIKKATSNAELDSILDALIKIKKDHKILKGDITEFSIKNSPLAIKYKEISKYFRNIIQNKFDTSIQEEDIQFAEKDFYAFVDIISAKADENITNDSIVEKLASFVGSVQADKQVIYLKNALQTVYANPKLVKALSKGIVSKEELVKIQLNCVQKVNKIQFIEQRIKFVKNKLDKASKQLSGQSFVISEHEKLLFNQGLDNLFENEINIDTLEKQINVKLNDLIQLIKSRVELDELEKQVNESIINVNDYSNFVKNKYLSPKAKQLATDLIGRIQDIKIIANVSGEEILAKKELFREQLRQSQKNELKHLYITTKDQINKLAKIDDNNEILRLLKQSIEKVSDKLTVINNETEKMLFDFNPIVSTELDNQIKKYKVSVNFLEVLLKQQESISNFNKQQENIKRIFDENGQGKDYVPTENEQEQLNKLADIQEQLNSVSQNILDEIDNPYGDYPVEETLANINKINSKVNDIAKKANTLNDAEKQIAEADDLMNLLKENNASSLEKYKEDFAKIEELKQKIKEAINDPNSTPEQITELTAQLNKAVQVLDKKRSENNLSSLLSDTDNFIDQTFNGEDTAGKKALKTRLEALKKVASEKGLSDEEVKKLNGEVKAVQKLVQKVKEIEGAQKDFENKSEAITDGAAEVAKVRTDHLSAITELDKLLKKIAAGEEIPTEKDATSVLNQSLEDVLKLEAGYKKDIIDRINSEIQKEEIKKTDSSLSPTELAFNESLKTIDKFAKDPNSTPSELKVNQMLENQKLIDIAKQALVESQKILNDSALSTEKNKEDSNAIEEAINRNLPGENDTPTTIKAKREALAKAVEEIKQKHKLRVLFENEVPTIVPLEESKRAILSDLVNNEIKNLKDDYNKILEKQSFDDGELEQLTKNLVDKIEELKQQRIDLINEYNQKVDDIKQMCNDDFQDTAKGQDELNQYSEFPEYKKSKDKFDKASKDTGNTTMEDLDAMKKDIFNAFYEDVVNKNLKSYEDETFNKFGTTSADADLLSDPTRSGEAYQKIKAQKEAFREQIQKDLKKLRSNPDVTKDDYDRLTQRINAVNKHINALIKVADQMNQYEKLKEKNNQGTLKEINNGIKLFKELLNSYPISPEADASFLSGDDLTSETNGRTKDLLDRLKNTQDELRTKIQNKNKIMVDGKQYFIQQSTAASDDVIEILKEASESNKVSAFMDPELEVKTSFIFNKLDEENEKRTKEKLQEVSDEINHIIQNKEETAALGLQVGSALKIKEQFKDGASETTAKYIDELNDLIDKARMMYGSKDQNVTEQSIKEHIGKIEAAKQRIVQSAQISNVVNELLQINKDIEYHQIGSVDGNNDTKNTVNRWLESIISDSLPNAYMSDYERKEHLKDVYQRALQAKNFVNKQKALSEQITEWKDFITTESVSNPDYQNLQTDVNNLINALWEKNPKLTKTAEDADNAEIKQSIEVKETKLQKIKSMYASRKESIEKLKNFKEWDVYTNSADTYINLYSATQLKLEAYAENIRNVATAKELDVQNQKISTLKDVYQKYIELAEKTNEVNAFASSVMTNEQNISDYKTDLINRANQAKKMYSREDVTVDTLETKIQELTLYKARIETYKKWSDVKQKIDSDTTLDNSEKAVLNKKLQKLDSALSQITIHESNLTAEKVAEISNQYQTIINEWLSNDVTAENRQNAINFVFENSKNLKNKINEIDVYLREQKGALKAHLDTAEVNQKYNELKQLQQQAKNANKQDPNDESLKINLIDDIQNKIDELIKVKRNSASTLISNTQAIIDLLKHPDNAKWVSQEITFDNVEEKIINAFTDVNNLTISEVNEKLEKAYQAFKKFVKDILTNQNDTLLKQAKVMDEFIENFSNDSDLWTVKGKQAREEIVRQKSLITAFNTHEADAIAQVIDSPDQRSQYIGINPSKSFLIDFILKNMELVKNGSLSVEKFVNQTKADVETLYGTDGIVNAINNVFERRNVISNSSTTLLEKANLTRTSDMLQKINSVRENLVSRLEEIKATTNAVKIQNYLQDAKENRQKYIELVNIFKNEIEQVLSKRSTLQEIYAELFMSVNWNTKVSGSDTRLKTLEDTYSAEVNKIKNLKTQIHSTADASFIEGNNILTNITKDSIDNILENIDSFTTWITKDKHQQLFKKLIDIQASNGKKAFEVVNPQATTTLEMFEQEFNKIKPSEDSISEIDITNASSLLGLFDEFAFTKIDVKGANQSFFNPLNFKVSIVKESGNWYTAKEMGNVETHKDVMFKFKYTYNPSNLQTFNDFDGLEIVKDVTISFKTKNIVAVQAGTSAIFNSSVSNEERFGLKAKVKIGNAFELGWASKGFDFTANKQAIVDKMLESFKKAYKLSNDDSFAIIDHNAKQIKLGDTTEVVPFNDVSNVGMKFDFAPLYTFGQYSMIKPFNSKQIIKTFVKDGSIVALVAVPSQYSIGFQQQSWNLDTITLNPNNTQNESKVMPAATINTLKFKFDVDENGNIYAYIDFFEMNNIAKAKSTSDSRYDRVETGNNNETIYVWTNEQFCSWILERSDSWANLNKQNNIFTRLNGSTANENHFAPFVKTMRDGDVIVKNARSSAIYIQDGVLNQNDGRKSELFMSGVVEFFFNTKEN
ncbi:hypothetical protein [Mycoplasma phocoenae]|uniref:Uncharacterized protein n=1 Tax=Mycoplasma phocoenae TaxID=754517 RepID=A0A858U2Q7_9MOLU|nr:hypothetical protein [Mycoplasma phocoenae]QJG66760.1 hypothetical protein HGG69_00225 [Mycoplasma phocoenae]